MLTIASALVTLHGGLGMLTMKNLLTGQTYDEMDGMIPYLELIIAGPIFLVLLILLIKTSNSDNSGPDT